MKARRVKWKKLAGLLTFFACAVAMAGGASLYIYRMELLGFSRAPAQIQSKQTVTVVVEAGAGPRSVARQLYDKGVISEDALFYDWLRFVAKDKTIKAGTYELSPGMSPEQILAVLQTGRQIERKFTIPEGLRKEKVATIIAGAGFGQKADILRLINSPEIIKEFRIPTRGAAGQDGVEGGVDGYLFPDTYQFPAGTDPLVILRRLRGHVDDAFDDRLRARMVELGWDEHKTLTLAAIIEKETGAKEERPHISSVFHNRMKLGMKLQTDPTVIYGIPGYDGNIRRRDLVRDHPYNTYVVKGLPPGPICQPGKAAIVAALFPSDDDDLYFVALGDSGRHQFCPTLECHNAAVQKWQVEFYRKPKP